MAERAGDDEVRVTPNLAAIEPLLAAEVRVEVTVGKDTYYGTLLDADAAFVVLVDAVWGWHGQSGWWSHGSAKRVALTTATVRHISEGKAPT